jgi:hypothetical protein
MPTSATLQNFYKFICPEAFQQVFMAALLCRHDKSLAIGLNGMELGGWTALAFQ